MKIVEGYSYDDVLLVPKYSEIRHRNQPLDVDLGKGVKLKLPIISANMKAVTGKCLAKKLASLGGLAILHRFYDDPNDQLKDYSEIAKNGLEWNIGISLGVDDSFKKIADSYALMNGHILCLDLAHADSKHGLEMINWLAKNLPDMLLIAGNIATAEGAQRLADNGADVIKCGIGNGSSCSTRINTANGVPSLTALENVYDQSFSRLIKEEHEKFLEENPNYRFKKYDFDYLKEEKENQSKRSFKIIADGGLSSVGSIVKSLVFSDAVMLGNMLARCDESPGQKIEINGKFYKEYAGSSTHKQRNIEGVKGLVEVSGSLENTINQITDGLRSGCSYQNAKDLIDLKLDPKFVKITHAGLTESKPHSIHQF
jgi:IMP dehydrogenase